MKLFTSLLRSLVLVLAFAGTVGVVAPATPAAANSPTPAEYRVRVGDLPRTTATPNRVQSIAGVVFAVFGALALLMVTIGGFRYIASDGDPQAAAKAKGTILYALVGLVVSISAFAIVTFVMGRV